MRTLAIILSVIAAAVLGLWAVFAFVVKPRQATTGQLPAAAPSLPKPPASQSGDKTAARIGAAADVVTAIGGTLKGLGVSFGGA